MDLLLDLGNTRVKWAWAQAGRLVSVGAAVWAELPAPALVAELAGADVLPARVALATVAPRGYAEGLVSAAAQRWGVPVAALQALPACAGVRNGYTLPAQLGVDRFAALVGAWQRAPGRAAVIADAGSALTVDVLDSSGLHLGGTIAPGLTLAQESFFLRTGRKPCQGQADPQGLARNTADAVASGALAAAVGAITRAWQLHRVRSGAVPALFLTGGDAHALSARIEIPHTLAPLLVLEGMLLMLGDRA